MVSPIKLQSLGGIKRDGTQWEGDYYIDGNWSRFQRGRPRKIGGYQEVTNTVPELTRGMSSFSTDGLNYLHLGHAATLGQYVVNNSGNLNAFNDRTPAGFAASADNLWQFDVYFEVIGGDHVLVGHAGLNLANIDNSTTTPIYAEVVTGSGALSTAGIGLADVSGGIVAVGVFLFTFGSDGEITYSAPNDFSGAGTTARITPQKIVKGFPLRGAGSGPAAIFWSLDSLIRATFTGGTPDFAFDTLATDISILSSQGVVEYDGVFYWPGVDRWLMFNGVVKEIPNELNQNFFFDNLNFTQRQKVFGFKVPRFGEIWWCFPFGAATECNHAVIYNVRENTWYDTPLPDGGRTAGVFAKVYQKPFMVDNDLVGGNYTLWQHETTKDKVRGGSIDAVASHYETAEISMLTAEQAEDKTLRVARVEPDFVQTGDMTMTVRGRANAKATVQSTAPVTFPDVATQPDQETIDLKQIYRLMSFRFDSNVQGGDYETGEPMAFIEPADGRHRS